jgi:hypothetical protein
VTIVTQACDNAKMPRAGRYPMFARGGCLLLRRRMAKKTAPVVNGGQVALVLSRCESLLAANGGVAVDSERSLGGGWPRCYGCSEPVEAVVPWGGAAAWAAKLFSINRICTLPFLILCCGVSLCWPLEEAGALPMATKCMR